MNKPKPVVEFGQPSAIATPPKQEPKEPPKDAPKLMLPTIGRRVWYWPLLQDGRAEDGGLNAIDHGQPFDAGVVFVHNAECVNLSVTDHAGQVASRNRVQLLQPDAKVLGVDWRGGVATWMPFQVNQVKA